MIAQISIQQGSGDYRLVGTERWLPAANGTSLEVGDSVRSGEGSNVAIQFSDGSILILEPSSELEIQRYSITREGDRVRSRVARVALPRGKVSGDVREDLVYPPSVFEIVTAGEIVTIRGTLSQ